MEVRHEGVDPAELEPGRDEEVGSAGERPAARERLEDAHRRRPDREHPPGAPDPLPRRGGDLVALPVHPVLLDHVLRERPEGVEADVQGDALDVEPGEQLGGEVEPGGRRRRRALGAGVDRLVSGRVGERGRDVRRQRRLARRLAVESQPPAPFSEVLQQLHRAVAPPGPQPPRRAGEALPEPVLVEPLEEQHLPTGALDRDPRGHDARVVHDDELSAELVRQVAEAAVPDGARRALVDEQARLVAPLGRRLRDQVGRELVIQLGRSHPRPTLSLPVMDQEAVRRAHERLQAAREGRLEQADVNATLERASAQLEALAQAAAQLEATVPTQVQTAVENGLREQVRPVGKNLAELRGLTNQLLRRLEAIEGGALAERHARVDDLALLVDLITSGWHGVDERLARIERALEQRSGAVVYRLEDHLQEPAGSGR